MNLTTVILVLMLAFELISIALGWITGGPKEGYLYGVSFGCLLTAIFIWYIFVITLGGRPTAEGLVKMALWYVIIEMAQIIGETIAKKEAAGRVSVVMACGLAAMWFFAGFLAIIPPLMK